MSRRIKEYDKKIQQHVTKPIIEYITDKPAKNKDVKKITYTFYVSFVTFFLVRQMLTQLLQGKRPLNFKNIFIASLFYAVAKVLMVALIDRYI